MNIEENTVAVIDYGMGNLRSVSQALRAAAVGSSARWRVVVTSNPETVRAAARVVLPGQGAMPECMRQLDACGLRAPLLHAAAHKPLLGICVGMQMLLDASSEGDVPCLGLLGGRVEKFDFSPMTNNTHHKLPHMGWNRVRQTQPHPLWRGIADGTFFYFVHSFYARMQNMHHAAGESDYGGRFVCAIAHNNLFATQFHPEKSTDQGLALLRNFLHWQP